LFAQADFENINSFVTSDKEADKIVEIIKRETNLKFNLINIYTPFHEYFGILNL